MILKSGKQSGIALVAVLAFSAVVLIITSTIYLRLTTAAKQINLREQFDQSNALTDAVLSNLIDWMNSQNYNKNNNPPNINTFKDALSFASPLYSTDLSQQNIMKQTPGSGITIDMADMKIDPLVPTYPLELANNNYSGNTFLANYMNSVNQISSILSSGGASVLLASLNSGSTSGIQTMGPNQLTNVMYRSFKVKSGRYEQIVNVSIIPLANNATNYNEINLHGGSGNTDPKKVMDHTDIFKVTAKACLPDCVSPRSIRKYELIVQRPIITSSNLHFDQAVYANSSIDIKNATTNSGTTFIDNTNQGDVFSNDNIAIGPNGKIGGKITSAKTVYFGNPNTVPTDPLSTNVVPDSGIPSSGHPLSSTTQIFDKANSRSHVTEIPPPQLNLDGKPSVECDTTLAILKDCKITGDYNQTKTQQYQGTIYVTGNFTQKGDFIATGTTPVKMIVDGKIAIGGNSKISDSLNSQSVIFISNYAPPAGTDPTSDPSIKIAGNPGTGTVNGAVFFTTQTNTDIQVRGNAKVFGAIVANGKVEFDGSMTMKRDTDLAELAASFAPTADQCKMQIVSWEEIKE
jgi:hypothetical protein